MTPGIVRFAPGSRTAWHVHALGQTLRVTDGVALVQARGSEAVAVHPGETVYTPPSEWHWHGATESKFMTHLALSETIPLRRDRRSPGASTSPPTSTAPPITPCSPSVLSC
jgi:quercetin dioxygenase-like cupin family protein